MTKKEIEKMAYKAYPVKNSTEYDKYGNEDPVDLNAGRREGYIRAMTEMRGLAKKFGEREAKLILDFEKLPKLHGWVARDKHDRLNLFSSQPKRDERLGVWFLSDTDYDCRGNIAIDDKMMFPEVTWKSGPVEVELLVRKASIPGLDDEQGDDN